MKVSIITITFNPGDLFDRTAESILNQSCTDYEFLVIDGKSSDGTIANIQKFTPAFTKKGIAVRWISEPDKGIYDAMNKGLRLAAGDYVWFVNAGDIIAEPITLENILKSIPSEKIDPDFIYGETLIVDSSGGVMGERRLKAPINLTWKSFRMGMLVCHQSMLVKRTLAPEYDLTYRYSGDFEWTIRCLKKASYIHNTGLVLSHFLDGGVSKKKMKASLKERFNIMAHYYGWLPTVLRHLWFVCRAAWFKLFHGWI
jgi:glycosyltransferase involved in cell wall biosynthesis